MDFKFFQQYFGPMNRIFGFAHALSAACTYSLNCNVLGLANCRGWFVGVGKNSVGNKCVVVGLVVRSLVQARIATQQLHPWLENNNHTCSALCCQQIPDGFWHLTSLGVKTVNPWRSLFSSQTTSILTYFLWLLQTAWLFIYSLTTYFMREIREVIVYCGIIISSSHGIVYTSVKKESDNESRFIVINFHLLPLLENTRLYHYHTFSKFKPF